MKKQFGAWMAKMFPMLAKMKGLRGTWFDPFGRTGERQMERALIREYEADMALLLTLVRDDTAEAALALAQLPLDIRGFGPVKEAKARKAAKRREELLAVLRAEPQRAAAE
jgi:indolepyruvate ferredoxin oxidoreductase